MKNSTKFLFLVVSFVSFKAEAALPAAFAVVRGAFQASRFALRHGIPVVKEAVVQTRPAVQYAQNFLKTNPLIKEHAAKIGFFIKQNPRQTAFIGTGAAVGYYFADKGVINKIGGTLLGAGSGAYLFGLRAANAARIALQTERATVASLSNQLKMTQEGYAAALAKLKDAAKPVAEKVGLGLGGKIPTSPSVVDQAKNFLNSLRWPKAPVHPELVWPAGFGAA